jgi:hypothetical protein
MLCTACPRSPPDRTRDLLRNALLLSTRKSRRVRASGSVGLSVPGVQPLPSQRLQHAPRRAARWRPLDQQARTHVRVGACTGVYADGEGPRSTSQRRGVLLGRCIREWGERGDTTTKISSAGLVSKFRACSLEFPRLDSSSMWCRSTLLFFSGPADHSPRLTKSPLSVFQSVAR